MRKFKKIRLPEEHVLSSEEMAMLEGGDYYPVDCKIEGKKCSIVHYSSTGSIAGFYDGTCKYGYVALVPGLSIYEYKFACIPDKETVS